MPSAQPGNPVPEYRSRLESHRQAHQLWDRRHRLIGNARVVTGLAAVAIAAISIGGSWISPWWLVVPAIVFVALGILHSRVESSFAIAFPRHFVL